jgi:ubiquinone/menaquinone biosynthesis C-methylase UbiE
VSLRKADYGDAVAATYDRRWAAGALQGIADALADVISQTRAQRVLEVGCGTGRWLREMPVHAPVVVGVDASLQMLKQGASANRVCALANALPFAAAAFEVVYCVNAIHHFDDPAAFIFRSSELLRSGGMLSIIGIDPRTITTRYFYHYFEGSREIDSGRYPSFGQLTQWMIAAGFQSIEYRIAENYVSRFTGDEVFSDIFLVKNSNSLLNLLTDAEYQRGISRMRDAISAAAAAGTQITFDTDLPFGMVTGTVPT